MTEDGSLADQVTIVKDNFHACLQGISTFVSKMASRVELAAAAPTAAPTTAPSNKEWDSLKLAQIFAYDRDQEYFGKVNDYQLNEQQPLHGYVLPKESMMQQRSTPTSGATNVEPSPRMQSTPTPGNGNQQWDYYPDGRVDAPYPLPAGSTPVSMILIPDINTTTDSLGFSNLNFSCLPVKQQSC